MQTIDVEFAFSQFLDRQEYDEAESALFSIVHAVFLAGWKAAGGELPEPRAVVRLLPKEKTP